MLIKIELNFNCVSVDIVYKRYRIVLSKPVQNFFISAQIGEKIPYFKQSVDSYPRSSYKDICKIWVYHILHTFSLLSDCMPLEDSLQHRFVNFIHEAIEQKSAVISNVAKLSIQNQWSNCGVNYCNILYAYGM